MTPAARVALVLGASAIAVPTIGYWEGTVNVGYTDIVGVATNCTGHTGPDVVIGKTYSDDHCAKLLAKDTIDHAFRLSDCINDAVEERLSGQTYGAFISFSYNVGTAAACKSGAVRKLNAGDVWGACAELSKWTYAGGKVVNGLVRRRNDPGMGERPLCERGLLR